MLYGPEWWTALFTGCLFIATLILASIAWGQIMAARKENRKTQTLLACGNYDTSVVIFECHRKISEAKSAGKLSESADLLRLEITTVLNFLDAIAIGIDQKLYIEDLAYSHLHTIVASHIHDIVETDVLTKAGCFRDNYLHLVELHAKWARKAARGR